LGKRKGVEDMDEILLSDWPVVEDGMRPVQPADLFFGSGWVFFRKFNEELAKICYR
jgi:hypothetical protein